jgi:acetyl-CoA C-acetyltransferase
MEEIVIVSAARSAIGGFGGALKTVRPLELATLIMPEVLQRGKVKPDWIGKVIFGNNMNPLGQNIARTAAYLSGIPEDVPGFTINSTCGSSVQAVISAVQAIRDGEAQIIIAGGVEQRPLSPYREPLGSTAQTHGGPGSPLGRNAGTSDRCRHGSNC